MVLVIVLKINGYLMYGGFMLMFVNVLYLELRYEILKFFMYVFFFYNLEDIF